MSKDGTVLKRARAKASPRAAGTNQSGRTQSEAVREALIALARSTRRADLAQEAERLNADRSDRAEKKKIAALMESLRAAR